MWGPTSKGIDSARNMHTSKSGFKFFPENKLRRIEYTTGRKKTRKKSVAGRGRARAGAVGRGRSRSGAVGRGRARPGAAGRGRSRAVAGGRGRTRTVAVGGVILLLKLQPHHKY